MARRKARETAFKLLYEDTFGVNTAKELFINLFDELSVGEEINQSDIDYIDQVFKLAKENIVEIDKVISTYAKGWVISRMPRVDLSLMRLALTEMLYMPDIPTAVSINEAVELSKLYSADDGPAFINGVLGAYVRGL